MKSINENAKIARSLTISQSQYCRLDWTIKKQFTCLKDVYLNEPIKIISMGALLVEKKTKNQVKSSLAPCNLRLIIFVL